MHKVNHPTALRVDGVKKFISDFWAFITTFVLFTDF